MKHIIILSIIALFVSACSSGGASDADVNYRDTVTVAVTPTLDCLPLFVAQETGIADSMQCLLRLQTHNAYADCDTAIIGRSADAAFSDNVRSEALRTAFAQKQAKRKRKDTLCIFPHDNLQLYMFTNVKARIKEAKQLTDKMVACDRKSSEAVLARQVLDSVGLKDDKTFIVEMLNVNTRVKMINANIMDAIIVPEPQASIVRSNGHKEIVKATTVNGKKPGCLVTRRNTRLITDIYNRACDSINKNGIHHYDSILIKRLAIPKENVKNVADCKLKKITAK